MFELIGKTIIAIIAILHLKNLFNWPYGFNNLTKIKPDLNPLMVFLKVVFKSLF